MNTMQLHPLQQPGSIDGCHSWLPFLLCCWEKPSDEARCRQMMKVMGEKEGEKEREERDLEADLALTSLSLDFLPHNFLLLTPFTSSFLGKILPSSLGTFLSLFLSRKKGKGREKRERKRKERERERSFGTKNHPKFTEIEERAKYLTKSIWSCCSDAVKIAIGILDTDSEWRELTEGESTKLDDNNWRTPQPFHLKVSTRKNFFLFFPLYLSTVESSNLSGISWSKNPCSDSLFRPKFGIQTEVFPTSNDSSLEILSRTKNEFVYCLKTSKS